MSRKTLIILPFLITSIMTSTDHGSHSVYTIYGRAVDEDGRSVNGADVVIRSAADRREIISGADGSFSTDICVYSSCDEILVEVQFGTLQGFERIVACGSHISAYVIVRDPGQ